MRRSLQARHKQELRTLEQYMHKRSVPATLRQQVLRFYEYVMGDTSLFTPSFHTCVSIYRCCASTSTSWARAPSETRTPNLLPTTPIRRLTVRISLQGLDPAAAGGASFEGDSFAPVLRAALQGGGGGECAAWKNATFTQARLR